MIFRKKKINFQPEIPKSRIILADSLFKKSIAEAKPSKQMALYWKTLETLSDSGDNESLNWGEVFRKLEPHLVEIPHGIREEILLNPAVQRLSNLTPILSGNHNLNLCSISAAEFQKAKSRLNRFRGHIGGSSAYTLEGVQAIFLYLLLFAGLMRVEGEQHWIHDSTESVEPLARSLVSSLLKVFEKKYESGGAA